LTVLREARALLPGRSAGRDPRANFALEEALFRLNEGLMLRVWENAESVIIGRAQLARYETDVDYCLAHSIPIVRRFTAGGTVYNGPGNLNWSVFVGRRVRTPYLGYETGPRAIFEAASRPLLAALASAGVEARLEPPNSAVTHEGKISGMAAYVSKDGFLCHGTLLVDADLGKVKALTTPSAERLERRYTRSRDVKTANSKADVDSFIRTFRRVLGEETGMDLESGRPDERERALAEELLSTRYSRDSWNLGDPFAKEGLG
jgi:lipoate---protein ligase